MTIEQEITQISEEMDKLKAEITKIEALRMVRRHFILRIPYYINIIFI